MKDWAFAQTDPAQELAEMRFFSIKKPYPGGEVEFIITVKEFMTPKEPTMRFFAQTDKETNQKTMPFRPAGWGKTLLEALAECVKNLDRFPYQGVEAAGR